MDDNRIVTATEKFIIYSALVVLTLIATFVGVADIIFYILLPALLAYSIVRIGYRHMLFECVLLVLGLSIATGGFAVQAFYSIVPGIVIGSCIHKQKPFRFVLTAASAGIVLVEGLMYLISAITTEQEIMFAQAFMQETEAVVSKLGLPAADSAMILELLNMYLPSILLVMVAMVAYAAFWVTLALLRKRMPSVVVHYPHFRSLCVRKTMLFVMVISGIVAFADKGTIGTVAANLSMLISFYVILCGYALMISAISALRSRVAKVIVFILFFWMLSMLSTVAYFIGMIDAFVHFRNRKRGDIE